jgi:hypothetical protein
VRLKTWKEYLEELMLNREWERAMKEALSIANNSLTLMSGVPENDIERRKET